MNAWKTADAVVRRLEAAIPVYDVRRTYDVEPRVRDDVGGWAR